MSKLWSIIISLMVVLTLGMAQAPRPCLGDAHGGACHAGSCQCVAECSCHAEHQRELAERAQALVCCHTEPACHMHASDVAPARAPGVAACHQHGHSSHFAPPQHRWMALFPEVPSPLTFAPGHAASNWAITNPHTLPLPPPEKPPRSLA